MVEMRAAPVRLRRTTGLPVAFGGLVEAGRRGPALDARGPGRRIPDPALRAELLGACGPLTAGTPTGGVGLAPREPDVPAGVAAGATNAEAAERLGLRPETVKGYCAQRCGSSGPHPRGGRRGSPASGGAAVRGVPATAVYSLAGAMNFLMPNRCYFPHHPVRPNFKV